MQDPLDKIKLCCVNQIKNILSLSLSFIHSFEVKRCMETVCGSSHPVEIKLLELSFSIGISLYKHRAVIKLLIFVVAAAATARKNYLAEEVCFFRVIRQFGGFFFDRSEPKRCFVWRLIARDTCKVIFNISFIC